MYLLGPTLAATEVGVRSARVAARQLVAQSSFSLQTNVNRVCVCVPATLPATHCPRPTLQALSLRSVEELEAVLGGDSQCGAVADLRQLFDLAAAYGYADWLVFDASVVRGLAYYTGGSLAGTGAESAARPA